MIPGLGRSPGEGNGNPLQHPCLENFVDRRAWWTAVHGVAKELVTNERLILTNSYTVKGDILRYRQSSDLIQGRTWRGVGIK